MEKASGRGGRLTLNAETIRDLSRQQLTVAAAGAAGMSNLDMICGTPTCDVQVILTRLEACDYTLWRCG